MRYLPSFQNALFQKVRKYSENRDRCEKAQLSAWRGGHWPNRRPCSWNVSMGCSNEMGIKDVLSSPHLPPALEQGLWVWCVHLHSHFPPFFLAISAYKFLESLPQIPSTGLVHVTAFFFSRKATVYTYCPINIIVPLSFTKISLFWWYIYYFTNPCRGTKFGFSCILLDFVVFPQIQTS